MIQLSDAVMECIVTNSTHEDWWALAQAGQNAQARAVFAALSAYVDTWPGELAPPLNADAINLDASQR